MSEELRGVVVCHGRLAGALVDAAEQISGVTGALAPVSNTGCDRGALEERVSEAVGAGPALVFVDLASGSCLFAVLNRLRASNAAKVVTGVSLAMLVDFVFHRALPLDEAAARAAIAGGKAIRVP
jgi:mannose/fructose-specific phosphotransferase system component IIA